MRVLFELAHPKHLYQFEPLMAGIAERAEVFTYAREKDGLCEILDEKGIPYEKSVRRTGGPAADVLALPRDLYRYYRYARSVRPDVIVSKASPYGVVVAKTIGAKHAIFPDSEVVGVTNRFVAPLANLIVTPENFGLAWGERHHRVQGIFESGYLHPDHFHPDPTVLEDAGLAEGDRFVVARFVSWQASHDVGKFGFTDEEKQALVRELSVHGPVLISAEGRLPSDLESHRVTVPRSKMHSLLHYASLFVGDSQTMAAEAALLGTPSVRYNSFVGPNDMTNFIMLEERFGALYNCPDAETATARCVELIRDATMKDAWAEKRRTMFLEMPDVNRSCMEALMSIA